MVNRNSSFSLLQYTVLAIVALLGASCRQPVEEAYGAPEPVTADSAQAELEVAYFASGCFWCVEAIFESVRGVTEAVSGYAGGSEENPTYEQVAGGHTGHAETVQVFYDPQLVSYATLVKVFFGSHDPTTLHQQGPDKGRQYRSAIFYQGAAELAIIKAYIDALQAQQVYAKPITTEVVPFVKFYAAEAYHQNYERNNPTNHYVQAVSVPRLQRFQAKFPELLKRDE